MSIGEERRRTRRRIHNGRQLRMDQIALSISCSCARLSFKVHCRPWQTVCAASAYRSQRIAIARLLYRPAGSNRRSSVNTNRLQADAHSLKYAALVPKSPHGSCRPPKSLCNSLIRFSEASHADCKNALPYAHSSLSANPHWQPTHGTSTSLSGYFHDLDLQTNVAAGLTADPAPFHPSAVAAR